MIDFVVSTITGQGMFPADMLRYDQATALTGLDSETIEESDIDPQGKWTVRVTSSRPATALRYASFGCKVASETRYMKNGGLEVYDGSSGEVVMYDSVRYHNDLCKCGSTEIPSVV
jgi:hypothetical protein